MDQIRLLERQCKALSQWRRLRIISFLKKHRHGTVGDIAEGVQCMVPTASQHLKILRDSGVVLDRRRGMNVVYVLSTNMNDIARTVLKAL
ncbi:MAG: metalloregulator ArsR/SmtB family transcription factor [Patescibacteria group bacterium]